jgi:predicted transcriptional regulator
LPPLTGPDYVWNMGEKMKFSVSLDADIGEALRTAADEDQEQISAVVSHALSDYLDRRRIRLDGLKAMEEYQAEFGEFTEEERTEARAWVAELTGRDEGRRQSA